MRRKLLLHRHPMINFNCQQEVVALHAIVALLQTENEGLNNQLKTTHSLLEDEVSLFQTLVLQGMDEKSRKTITMENTMENIFQNIVDRFGDKTDIIDGLDIKVKDVSHVKNDVLKKKICRLEVDRT